MTKSFSNWIFPNASRLLGDTAFSESEVLSTPLGPRKRKFGDERENELELPDQPLFYPRAKRRKIVKTPIPKPKWYNLRRELLQNADAEVELLDWIRVWWPRKNCWYRAQVCQINPLVVTYEDGEKEWLGTNSIFNVEKYGNENSMEEGADYPTTNPRLMETEIKKPDLYRELNGEKFQNFRREVRNEAACWILNGSDFSWTWCKVKLDSECESLRGKKLLKVVVQGDNTIHKVDPSVNDIYIFDYKMHQLERILVNFRKARMNGKAFSLPPPPPKPIKVKKEAKEKKQKKKETPKKEKVKKDKGKKVKKEKSSKKEKSKRSKKQVDEKKKTVKQKKKVK